MSIDFTKLFADDESAPAGATAEQIAAWEARHGVKLPKVLARALRQRNGGTVRYSDVALHALAEIEPIDPDLLEHAAPNPKKFANTRLVFHFASGDDEPLFFLNFNANGPEGEPTVYHWFHDPSELRPNSKTVKKFLADLLAVSPTPDVDWSETDRLDEVLFRERIDTKDDYEHVDEYAGQEVYEEVVLGRLGGVLVHYTHEVTVWGESFCKTALPEPLSRSDANIDQQRPAPGRTYGLHLEPRDGDGIVCTSSERQPDGTWKNATEHGVPVYVTVESRSKDALKALREKMFGKKAARKVAEQDDATERMERMFESLDPRQRAAATAAFAGEMLDRMMGEMEGELADIEDDLPEEQRSLLAGLDRAVDGLQQRSREQAQAGDGDPEVAELLDAMRKANEEIDEDDLDEDD